MSKSFYEDLNELCNNLDEEYDINNGGCCYTAAIIAEHLDKLHVNYSLCVYTYDYDMYNYKDCLEAINNKDCNSFPCGYETANHYFLYIPKYRIYINGGTWIEERQCIIKLRYIKSSQIKWIYETGDWNSTYDTDLNKKVRTKIDNFFKNYEKEKRK